MEDIKGKRFILTSIISFICTFALAQIHGIVKEQGSNKPLEFVNVVLLSHSDSTVVTGVTTDSTGYFAIEDIGMNHLIRMSFIGYKTKIIDVAKNKDLGTILMQRDESMLGEVTVRAKTYLHTAEGITVNIGNGPLSKLGNATDVLKHLPFVMEKNNSFSVIGKGTPVIYINNRRLRDNNELNQISSSDIRQVQVITNPGAEYDATVNAVIKITTSRPIGEGWGGSIDAGISSERKLSHHGEATVDYSTGGLDVFTSLRYDRDMSESNQRTNRTYSTTYLEDALKMRDRGTTWYGNVGFNYQHRNNLSLGMLYKYTSMPHDAYKNLGDISFYNNKQSKRELTFCDNRSGKTQSHHLNAYLNYNFTKDTYLTFDADYLRGTGNNHQDYFQAQDGIHTKTNSHNKLYASRIKFITPFIGGTITTGMEGSYTHNNNAYTVLDGTTLNNELQSSHNVAKQKLLSGFTEYKRQFGERWSANIGGRFEHVDFNYFADGIKDNETSKVYNGFYPSAGVAYNGNVIQMSLAYRYTTIRPSYFMLRSSVEFNNPYSYESGSPSLQPQKTRMLSFSLSWKDIQLMTNYSWISNSTMYVEDMYQGSDSIDIFHTQNINKNQVLNIALFYSPTLFKIWNPSVTLDMAKPYLTFHNQQYNKPIFVFQLDNTLTLPHHFILGADMSLNTGGNLSSDLSYYHTDFDADAYCVKSFLHDHLRLKLAVTNVFNTDREKWRKATNGIILNKWNDGGKRTVLLTVNYRFNPSKKKYKGESSTDELNRL
ncbi:MAG: outer membrane beta-barrel protein [Prevotella sp.]|jgi:hypothetical protein|nr:outer membrane beta-barrel family protein [Prevotella sp.]MCH3994674.1 outer membrane beta-barrel protein [Prevotella sp.]MCI1246409.1 outer membrane beta-barrel protein [Prevotella sp.]